MNDTQYRDYCLRLLNNFSALLDKEATVSSTDDPIRELAQQFGSLAEGDRLHDDGPELLSRLFSSCPMLAPRVPRDLLWFFGGECLHFMPDDELAMFQLLDDMRLEAASAGEQLDYQEAKAKLLKLQ
jgi:hypothetical protein